MKKIIPLAMAVLLVPFAACTRNDAGTATQQQPSSDGTHTTGSPTTDTGATDQTNRRTQTPPQHSPNGTTNQTGGSGSPGSSQ